MKTQNGNFFMKKHKGKLRIKEKNYHEVTCRVPRYLNVALRQNGVILEQLQYSVRRLLQTIEMYRCSGFDDKIIFLVNYVMFACII